MALAGLRGFEAVARLGSFSRAAVELNLTQSAASRQIQTLERDLGATLFTRGTRSLALTAAGRDLLRAVRDGLDGIDAAVARIRSRGRDARKAVTLTTYASLASMWLLPRLPKFSARHPDVDVRIIATDAFVDLMADGCDLAIRYGPELRAPAGAVELFRDTVFPVCSPALLTRQPIAEAADLRGHVLLRFEQGASRYDVLTWEHWFAAQGVKPVRPRSSIAFTYQDQMVQAALRGQGVAIARAPLIADLMHEGDLVAPFGSMQVEGYSHYLLVSPQPQHREEVTAFCAWLDAEAAFTRARVKALVGKALVDKTPGRGVKRAVKSIRDHKPGRKS